MRRDAHAKGFEVPISGAQNMHLVRGRPGIEESPMQSTTVSLVKESFGWVAPISDNAAAIFYARLFETNPDLKSLFKNDMKEQGRKLMATIAVVVNSLD